MTLFKTLSEMSSSCGYILIYETLILKRFNSTSKYSFASYRYSNQTTKPCVAIWLSLYLVLEFYSI